MAKKQLSPQEWRGKYPVHPEYEHLLMLGASFMEYEKDASRFRSLVLAYPLDEIGDSYYGSVRFHYDQWGIYNPSDLEHTVVDLIRDSRTPEVDRRKLKKAQQKVEKAFMKATHGISIAGADFSGQRIRSIQDIGAHYLEFAAYLARGQMQLSWGSEQHAIGLLQEILPEVRQRFMTWSDYIISVQLGSRCTNMDVRISFGAERAPEYVYLLGPDGYYGKYPLQ
ncbi:MAG: DUF1266 domain-containing protein [Peptococcaceae bacterium]|nr:DUF1266 domain-containing protein [Peptococcaceae bacterium]